MEPTIELIDELHREKVRTARSMSFEEKFLAGARLFDYACGISRAGIRMQHPDADEAEVERLLARRIEIGTKLENAQ